MYFKDNNFNVLSLNDDKDTLFHIIQYAKLEFIVRAININNNDNNVYAWIDIGIYKIFKSQMDFEKSIINIHSNLNLYYEYNKIIATSCWLNIIKKTTDIHNFTTNSNNFDINNKVCWVFCGGFLLGNKYTFNLFYNLFMDELLYITINKLPIIYEVNIWYIIFKKNISLFNLYKAVHNITMFNPQ